MSELLDYWKEQLDCRVLLNDDLLALWECQQAKHDGISIIHVKPDGLTLLSQGFIFQAELARGPFVYLQGYTMGARGYEQVTMKVTPNYSFSNDKSVARWVLSTDIEHETFRVYDKFGKLWCIGLIVEKGAMNG